MSKDVCYTDPVTGEKHVIPSGSYIGQNTGGTTGYPVSETVRQKIAEGVRKAHADGTVDKELKSERQSKSIKKAYDEGRINTANKSQRMSKAMKHLYENGQIDVAAKTAKQAKSQTGNRWKQPELACPHCGKQGGKGLMKRYHFDNCEVVKPKEKLSCPHCGRVDKPSRLKKSHFDNCRKKPN
jgi:hypothetical protein